MKISDMSERQMLEQLLAGQAKLETGQLKLEVGQQRLEDGQKSLNDKIDFVTALSDKRFVALQETLDEHTGSLNSLKLSSKEQLELLDTIAAATGANTSDLLALTRRHNRLEKIRR